MAKLKNYRVKTGKTTVVVQLSEETKNRLYPNAVEHVRKPKATKQPAPNPEDKDNDGGDNGQEPNESEETLTGEPTGQEPPAANAKNAKKTS